jgi:hypothetical protein
LGNRVKAGIEEDFPGSLVCEDTIGPGRQEPGHGRGTQTRRTRIAGSLTRISAIGYHYDARSANPCLIAGSILKGLCLAQTRTAFICVCLHPLLPRRELITQIEDLTQRRDGAKKMMTSGPIELVRRLEPPASDARVSVDMRLDGVTINPWRDLNRRLEAPELTS